MKLYIMRHGEASRGSEDSLRALTDLGQEQVRLISSFLNSKGNDIDVIWHSSIHVPNKLQNYLKKV